VIADRTAYDVRHNYRQQYSAILWMYHSLLLWTYRGLYCILWRICELHNGKPGIRETGVPSGVQGRSPDRGSGRRSPQKAKAFL